MVPILDVGPVRHAKYLATSTPETPPQDPEHRESTSSQFSILLDEYHFCNAHACTRYEEELSFSCFPAVHFVHSICRKNSYYRY